MTITDLLAGNPHPFASFELVPPLKGSDTSKLYDAIKPLMEFQPPFLNVTSHRDEIEYRKTAEGQYRQVVVTKRPSTLAIAAAIMKRFHIEVVPHVICGGATKMELENTLLDLHFLGIRNVMALRGDAIPGEKYFTPTPGGHKYSSELVAQITEMNRGHYQDDSLKDAVSTDFCIGVGAYPEKHCEAPNQDEDIRHLREKVDAGADYIITQMFFDNQKFYDFENKCRMAGITVPIIPGIKPISTLRHIELLPHAFSIDIPQPLMTELKKCRDNAAVYQVGKEWCVTQCRDLLSHGAKAIHFYTMGRAENIREVIRKSF